MTHNTDTLADDTPADEHSAERDAIRSELGGTDVYVLTYYGSEPMVALVERDKAPPTEYPSQGEKVVLVEWHGGKDWALSVAEGASTGWELVSELEEMHDSRSEAIEAAVDIFNE